ncbi:MAG: ATPase central domain protein [Actinomycetia bacterium]|nr:ATPase central domain protein [Actinomycetes bacterium]
MKKAAPPEQGLGLRYVGGRPRDEDVLTRRKLSPWDRSKWLVLLVVIWLLLVWSLMANNPLMGFLDAAKIEVQIGWWVFILIGLELIHQIHFFISEHSAAYNQFWVKNVWGRWARFSDRKISAWAKFRISRVISWIVVIAVIAIITGKIIHAAPLSALLRIPQIVWSAMPFVVQIVFTLFFVVAQFGMLFWFLSRGGVDVYYPDDIKTRFTDVWGQDHVLERVKENIIFLENPELVEDRGGYVPGGLLLWGPPGTGKTLMAEAVAGETGKPYVFVDPGAFINMFMGIGVLKVKGLFRKLRKLALRYGGVIVFFDEADSLGNRGIAMGGAPGGGNVGAGPANTGPFTAGCHGFSYLSSDSQWRIARDVMSSQFTTDPAEPGARRDKQMVGGMMNGGMGGGGMGTLQALLTELSGLKKPRGFINRVVRRMLGMRPKPPPHYRILVMMATNAPSALDEALLRPGRIDRMYRVGYPSKAGRIRTYEGYLAKVSHELTAEQVDKLATITPYATGATIKDMVNEALIIAIRDGRDVITYQDVIKAKQFKELGPPEDVEYIERERHAVAIHEACHAVVAYRTRQHMEIDIATIEKGSDYLGIVSSIKPEDQFTRWRSEYESDILVALASLAGERMYFDSDSSSGVSGDLDSATTVASFMEGYWGMGKTVSSAASARRLEAGTPGGAPRATAPGAGTGGEGHGPSPFARLADRIEDNLGVLLGKVEEILGENERHVLALAHALETHKTLSGEDVTAVFEGGHGPLVNGAPYADDAFIAKLSEYHLAAKRAHQQHNHPDVQLPVAEPAYAIADGYGAGSFLDGSYNGNGNGTGVTGTDDVIDFGGFGTGNGSQGTLGAPTYDPPSDGPDNEQS